MHLRRTSQGGLRQRAAFNGTIERTRHLLLVKTRRHECAHLCNTCILQVMVVSNTGFIYNTACTLQFFLQLKEFSTKLKNSFSTIILFFFLSLVEAAEFSCRGKHLFRFFYIALYIIYIYIFYIVSSETMQNTTICYF